MQHQSCGPPLWLYLCVKSVGCSQKWPLGPHVQHCPETAPARKEPRAVRDKMVFIMGAPTCFPQHLAAPVCVAHKPSGMPGDLQLPVWSALPHTESRQKYYKKMKLQTNILHQHRKQIIFKNLLPNGI